MNVCVNAHTCFSASGGEVYSYFLKILLTLGLVIAKVVAYSNKTMDSRSYIIAFDYDRNHILCAGLFWTTEHMTECVCA